MTIALVLGIQVLVLGLVLFAITPAVRRRWPGASSLLAVGRTLAVVAGIALLGYEFAAGATPMSRTPNPVPLSVTSVDAGARLYQANCAACHGVAANGDGPLAGTTRVQAPSLKAHLGGHTDGDLFYWISNGMPGGMPAWDGQLSETDRWNLVNYLRSINGAAPVAGNVEIGARPAQPSPSTIAGLAVPLALGGGMVSWLLAGYRRASRSPRRRT